MSYARLVRSVVAAAAAVIALSQAAYCQHDAYQTIENWFKLPEGRKIGSTAGITVDRDGTSVWTFDRCGGQFCAGSNLTPIMKFDESGKLFTSFPDSSNFMMGVRFEPAQYCPPHLSKVQTLVPSRSTVMPAVDPIFLPSGSLNQFSMV